MPEFMLVRRSATGMPEEQPAESDDEDEDDNDDDVPAIGDD